MDRHFCSTTYILHKEEKKTLLHWHKKLKTWLPPGGHIEKNESPYEAAIREVKEEYHLSDIEYIHPNTPKRLDDRSFAMEMPHFLISEDIEPEHIHMDWIFFAKISDDEYNEIASQVNDKIKWFNIAEIRKENNCFENVKELAIYGMNEFY